VPDKLRVLVTFPDPLFTEIVSAGAQERLGRLATVDRNMLGRSLTGPELAERVGGVDACFTSWGTPAFDEGVLAAADRLRLIAHAAASVKNLTPLAVYRRGIKVTHAAATIAEGVAEFNLAAILVLLRNMHRVDHSLKTDRDWAKAKSLPAHELRGRTVGIISASRTGLALIPLLRPFGCRILIHSLHMTPERAAGLGAEAASLDDLLRNSDVVAMHAPSTPATRQMLGAREFALMRDGAIFTSTARAWVLDEAALLQELESGRISAALDVFETEPLPPTSPFFKLENVLLAPHMAGNAQETRARLGDTIVDEIERFCRGEPLRYEITEQRLAVMA
jgi:phosphoglycerate dehydrogenase-like enzyme